MDTLILTSLLEDLGAKHGGSEPSPSVRIGRIDGIRPS